MAFLVLPLLALLPGAWIAFATREDALRPLERLALAIALSPPIGALQYLALTFAGLSAEAVAPTVLGMNLPVLALIVWRCRGERRVLPSEEPSRTALFPALLALAVPVGWLLVSWLVIDGLRAFGWHNLMHVDLAAQVARLPAPPEEPELAGHALHYSWFGHAFWVAAGRLLDEPLTRIHPLLNLIWLGSVFTLVHRTARERGLHASVAALAAALAVFGDHLVRQVGALVGLVPDDAGWLGDPRLTSPLSKFLYIDLMPAAFAMLAGLLLLWTLRERLRPRTFALLVTALLVGMALYYPVSLPAGLAALAAFVLWEGSGRGGTDRGPALRVLVAMALAVGVGGAWGLATDVGGRVAPATFQPPGQIGPRTLHVLFAIGPFLLLGLPALRSRARERRPFVMALLALVLLLGAVHVFLDVRRVSYKFVSFARLPLALLVACGIEQLAGKRARARWTAAFAVLGVVGLVGYLGIWTKRRPPSLDGVPPIVEDRFQLALAPESPDAGWTRAVREETPADTVLVAHDLSIHASSFTGRALYFPGERDPRTTAGYSLRARRNLVDMRGHPPEMYDERQALIANVFSRGDDREERRRGFVASLAVLRALERPIAIRAQGGTQAFTAWLGRRGAGRLLFEDEFGLVWLLPAP